MWGVGYYIMRSLGVLCSSVRTVTAVDGGNHTENGHLENGVVGRTNLQGFFRKKCERISRNVSEACQRGCEINGFELPGSPPKNSLVKYYGTLLFSFLFGATAPVCQGFLIYEVSR